MDLNTLYTCFILGGFVLPAINVAAGAIGGAFHLGGDLDVDTDPDADADLDVDTDLDADVGLDTDVDLDAGVAHAAGHAPIPVNLMTLSFAAVVFGAVGRLLLPRLPVLPGAAAALLCAGLGGALLGRFVLLPLKRNRAYATNVRRLRGAEGVVRLEIRDDFEGKISLPSATGSIVTYGARPAPGVHTLSVGQKVVVVGVDTEKEVCVVQPVYSETPEESNL